MQVSEELRVLFHLEAVAACEEWKPTSEEGDEWWVGVYHEDGDFDINLFVGYNGEIRANVYPVIDGQTKTDDDRLVMKLW